MSCGPQIHLRFQTQPLWSGYNISEIRLNITDDNNEMVLTQISIPLNGQTEYHFHETLSHGTSELCVSSVLFTATALNPVYGESISSTIEVTLDRCKKSFPILWYSLSYLFISSRILFRSSNKLYCVLLPKWHSISLCGD